jgi:hypothetical protein
MTASYNPHLLKLCSFSSILLSPICAYRGLKEGFNNSYFVHPRSATLIVALGTYFISAGKGVGSFLEKPRMFVSSLPTEDESDEFLLRIQNHTEE